MVRFNDVIADPAGRVFAGSIGKNAESGGLYRMDVDGTITRLRSGTACSNPE
jgi:D-xylonolactonase